MDGEKESCSNSKAYHDQINNNASDEQSAIYFISDKAAKSKKVE